jgi:hypothetical protein
LYFSVYLYSEKFERINSSKWEEGITPLVTPIYGNLFSKEDFKDHEDNHNHESTNLLLA